MDIKQIPTIIMLIGGASSCVISLIRQADAETMFRWLLITLICFFILGQIFKVVLEKNFADVLGLKKETEEENEENAEEQAEENAAEKTEDENEGVSASKTDE